MWFLKGTQKYRNIPQNTPFRTLSTPYVLPKILPSHGHKTPVPIFS
jgi:hypothetical protein